LAGLFRSGDSPEIVKTFLREMDGLWGHPQSPGAPSRRNAIFLGIRENNWGRAERKSGTKFGGIGPVRGRSGNLSPGEAKEKVSPPLGKIGE